MLTRRFLLTASLAPAAALAFGAAAGPARAQTAQQAAAFIQQAGSQLTGVINAPGTLASKQQQLQQIVDNIVDVDAVARFCLGRFWRSASPQQQQDYLKLFHQVLNKSITSKLGEFQGVTFTVGRTVPRDDAMSVETVVNRPGAAPANVAWVVANTKSGLRIIDLIAEGTSLRLTQRSDYDSYLAHNGYNVQALLDAMRQQVTQSG